MDYNELKIWDLGIAYNTYVTSNEPIGNKRGSLIFRGQMFVYLGPNRLYKEIEYVNGVIIMYSEGIVLSGGKIHYINNRYIVSSVNAYRERNHEQ